MTNLTFSTYALKSIRRNFRRSGTLMFGVIISLAIVSGVLFYLDSTSGELVQSAFSDVHIDTAISDSTMNEADVKSLQEFIESDISDIILSAEIIVGTKPFAPNTVGAIVAGDNAFSFSLDSTTLKEIFASEGNFTTTYIFGIEPSYLDEFPIFSTTENVSQIFENDQVLISTSLDTFFSDDTDDILNISLVSFDLDRNKMPPVPNLGIETSINLTVGGTVNFDTAAMEDVNYAFDPTSLESENDVFAKFLTMAQIPNCIIMSYSNYMELVGETTSAISLNGVHIKLDHSQFSSDTSVIYSQLTQISSYIEVYYPETTIVDLLELSLDQVANQLDQMRLFLIYFSLPGILLGAYISKYAIDLTIEERQREIGILRTKSALRRDIALAIGTESFIISGIGLIIGIFVGYLASLSISNLLNGGSTGLNSITLDSLVISVAIGFIIVFVAAFFSSRQLLSPSVTETLKEGKEQRPSLWRRIYLDFILLGIVIIVAIMNVLEFNPIPGFATAIYDFIAPLLTWIGLTLLMVRILESVLFRLEGPVLKIYSLIFKDLAHVITRNILYKPQRITRIMIVLSLTLSFGLVISTINETYQQGAQDDAMYQVGADLRIEFPSSDYLDYNTSDFVTTIEDEFSSEIAGTTSIYSTTFKMGRQLVLVVGIEPETFFEVAMVKNSFFQTNDYEATKEILLDNSTGSYSNVIISTGLASPNQDSKILGGRLGGQEPPGFDIEIQTFSIGDSLPIGQNETDDVEVVDIVAHFPAVADLTGKAEESLQFIICNVEFLLNPTQVTNTTYLASENATYLLVDTEEGYEHQEIENSLLNWYSLNYPDSNELSIDNFEEYYESYSSLITSLTGLTSMEFILVLTVSTLGFEIFLTSSLYERKKEYGTYYAIGAPVNDVRKLILGELSLITGFSLVTGIILSGLVSYIYLGFISDLLVLEVHSVVFPLESIIGLSILVILSMTVVVLHSGRKLARLDPVNILRTV